MSTDLHDACCDTGDLSDACTDCRDALLLIREDDMRAEWEDHRDERMGMSCYD